MVQLSHKVTSARELHTSDSRATLKRPTSNTRATLKLMLTYVLVLVLVLAYVHSYNLEKLHLHV